MIATLAELISNPLTVIPIYSLAVLIGETVSGLEITVGEISFLIETLNVDTVLSLSSDLLLILGTGLWIEGVLTASIAYLITFYLRKFIIRSKQTSQMTELRQGMKNQRKAG